MADSIHYLVSREIVNILKQATQTSVPANDLARVDIIKVGLFQENPKHDDANVYITVTPGIRGRDDVYDGIVTLESFPNLGLDIPAREIGGGVSWWRIFGVEYGMYYIKAGYEEETILNAAGVLQQRIINALDGKRVNICDDFGECVCELFAVKAEMFESGGVKPKTFIWRGRVIVMALSERQ